MTDLTVSTKPYLLRKENRYLWFTLILPAYLIAFAWVEAWIPVDACKPTYIPLDDQIPFLEGFIVPYMLWFPMILALGLYLMRYDHEGFKRYMTYLGVAFFTVIALYLLFPNRQDLRVTHFPRDNVFTQLVALVYSQDTNTNVCPQHSCGRLHGRLLCRLELPPLAQALDPGVYLDRICPCGRLHRVCQAAFRAGSDFGRSLQSGRLSCGLPADFSQNVRPFLLRKFGKPLQNQCSAGAFSRINYAFRGFRMAAWAAARRAMGTRKGLQET